MKHNFAGPPTMRDQILVAKTKMKLGKTITPDRISVRHLEALEYYGVDKITTLLNEIYDTNQIPPNISNKLGQQSANCIERSVL